MPFNSRMMCHRVYLHPSSHSTCVRWNYFFRMQAAIAVSPTLILVQVALRSAALSAEKKKQAAAGKVVLMPGKPICVVKQIQLIGEEICLWPRESNSRYNS